MEVPKPLLPYHVEDILKLHGRVYSELSGDDLILFDLYAQKGREFGIACQIINQADPDQVLRAVSYDDAIGIMRKAGSRVAVFKTPDHLDTKCRACKGTGVGSSATYQAGPREGMGVKLDQDVARSLGMGRRTMYRTLHSLLVWGPQAVVPVSLVIRWLGNFPPAPAVNVITSIFAMGLVSLVLLFTLPAPK